jgi:Fur family ferric uptake transcriptional regulator
VCSSCHRVVEVEQCGLGNWLDTVTAQHGFVATDHRVEITGLCAACR